MRNNSTTTLAGSGLPRTSTALPEVDSNGQVIASLDRDIEDAVGFAVPSSQCAICLRPFTDGNGDVCAKCWSLIPHDKMTPWDWAVLRGISVRSAQPTSGLYRWGLSDRRLLIEQFEVQAPMPIEPRHGLDCRTNPISDPEILARIIQDALERPHVAAADPWIKTPKQWADIGPDPVFVRTPVFASLSALPYVPAEIVHGSMHPRTSSGKEWSGEWLINKENRGPIPTPREKPDWSHFHSGGEWIIDWYGWDDSPHYMYKHRVGIPGLSVAEPQMLGLVIGGRYVQHTKPQSWELRLHEGRPFTIRYPENFYPKTVEQYDLLHNAALDIRPGFRAKFNMQLEESDCHGVQLGDPFDYARYSAAVGRNKVDSDLRSWAHSQAKPQDKDPNIKRLRSLRRYKTVIHFGDYNSSEESYGESGDSSGVNAPISAHRTGKYYGGDAKHPENGSNSTGWAGYVKTGCSRDFRERETLQALQRFLILEPGPAAYESILNNISCLPADQPERDFIQQQMCSKYPSLPEAYCSHCQGTSDGNFPADADPHTPKCEPVSDTEPDVFESEETDAEPIDESDAGDDDEPEDEAIEAIESVNKNKPFEFSKRTYELDDPAPIDEPDEDSHSSRSGFAGIDDLLKHKSKKPWRGRIPWWKYYWPDSVIVPPPIFGYGNFVKFRPWLRDPKVSVAGERLVWEEIEALCKHTGLIWKEEWQVKVWTGSKYAMRPQMHEYGRSILDPDMAFKNETYINVNPTLRTGPGTEKAKAVQHANKILILSTSMSDEEREKIMAVLAGEPGADNDPKVRKLLHDLRKKAKQKADDPNNRRRWARALKASNIDPKEPGIFALTHFPRSTDRVYKIADAADTKEIVWTKFHNVVLTLIKDRVAKNRSKPKNEADLLKLYNRYAWGLLNRGDAKEPWRISPKAKWEYEYRWFLICKMIGFPSGSLTGSVPIPVENLKAYSPEKA